MTEQEFETRKGMAQLMGYNTHTRWGERFWIVYPSGKRGTWAYETERDAWIDIFDIVGLTDGRLFAGQ